MVEESQNVITIQMALEHTFISMLIVFCVLLLISFIIYSLKFIPVLLNSKKNNAIAKNNGNEINKANNEANTIKVQNVAGNSQAASGTGEEPNNDLQIIAVISAAISAAMSEEKGIIVDPGSFVIRSIKKRR